MPIETTWYDEEKTIILHTYTGTWTVRELFQHLDEVAHMVEGSSIPCYFISDLRKSKSIPVGILSQLHRFNELDSVEGTYNIVIGVNPVLRTLATAMQRMGLQMDVAFADSLEEADTLITAARANERESEL